MLYFLSFLSDGGDVFNLFRYITFRAGGAFFTALIIFFTFGKYSINFLKKLQKEGQPISCLLYTSPSPRDRTRSRMPSSA